MIEIQSAIKGKQLLVAEGTFSQHRQLLRSFPESTNDVDIAVSIPAPVRLIVPWMQEFRVPEDLPLFLQCNQVQQYNTRGSSSDGPQG